ncbi:hypothetical protein [Mycolicibacterium neworleansense]|uniref:Uncharacterized protein n=1 Tax=Mycolicibacterium neworleansense TaxID=146018 RepID=A0A0H5RQL2_9MYCO|nr:hypothetical protein [Mycolicibacterium neworleansense]MCV7365443.1 hypothetical protein [Mycolicibacterium neworleansense]CRZ16253.1 hypothetical protein BN2156_03120 [Mycolicibacterium neworleansense]
MVENLLADGGIAYQIGSTIGAILWPTVGALLLTIGVRRRIAHTRWVRHDDDRLLHPDGSGPADDRPPPQASNGTWFMISGTVLLIIGVLHLAALAIDPGTTQNLPSPALHTIVAPLI